MQQLHALHLSCPQKCTCSAPAHRAMQASSWREQELLDQRLAEAQASREQLASELKRAQRAAATAAAEAAVLRKELGEREAAAKKLGGELQRAGAALAAARAEVCKEQALVHSLRSKAKVRSGCVGCVWLRNGDSRCRG